MNKRLSFSDKSYATMKTIKTEKNSRPISGTIGGSNMSSIQADQNEKEKRISDLAKLNSDIAHQVLSNSLNNRLDKDLLEDVNQLLLKL